MSSKPERYVQCRMRRKLSANGNTGVITTGWIAERGAKLGAKVELITPEGTQLWEVVSVGNTLPREVLKEAQDQRRKPPPSIRDTAKDKRQQASA